MTHSESHQMALSESQQMTHSVTKWHTQSLHVKNSESPNDTSLRQLPNDTLRVSNVTHSESLHVTLGESPCDILRGSPHDTLSHQMTHSESHHTTHSHEPCDSRLGLGQHFAHHGLCSVHLFNLLVHHVRLPFDVVQLLVHMAHLVLPHKWEEKSSLSCNWKGKSGKQRVKSVIYHGKDKSRSQRVELFTVGQTSQIIKELFTIP